MLNTRTAYIQANDIGDQLMKPEGVVVRITSALIERLQSARALCTSYGLESVSVRQAPDAWLPAGLDEELRLCAPTMVVTRNEFWFEDQPKNARDHVECIPVHIDALLRFLASDDRILIAGDDDEFDEYAQRVIAGTTTSETHKRAVDPEQELAPPDVAELMSRALTRFALIGDVFTRAPESAGSVAAAQNLQVLAALQSDGADTVAKGTLLAGQSAVSDVDIRADGSLVVNLPDDFDTSSRTWTVVTTSGAVYRVKFFVGGSADEEKWLIDEPQQFYEDLLQDL